MTPESVGHFRRVLGRVPTPVAVIASVCTDGEPIGVAVGSFSSVSLDPPLVGFYIAETSTTWPLLASTGGFCANILSTHQEEVSRLFATQGANKFGGTNWRPGPLGRPVLEGVAAWLDCEIIATHPAGDHIGVLGRIITMDLGDDDPLVFVGGRYGRVAGLGRDDNEWE